MRLRSMTTVALAAGLALSQPAAALERWRLGGVATTDYVLRGVSQSAGKPALQGSVAYRFDSGVYAGLWGSTISNARTVYRGAAGRYELGVIIGFAQPWGEDWDIDVAVARYVYPDSGAPVSHAYTEFSAVLGYRGRLRVVATAAPNTTLYTRRGLNGDRASYALELVGEQPLGRGLSGIGGVGFHEVRGPAGGGYAYFSAGVAARMRGVDVELMYIDTHRGERLFGGLAGSRAVLSLVRGF